MNLAWTASTDNVGVAGYDVYRNGAKVGSTTSVSYSDTSVTASTAYSYTVQAKDAAGNLSTSSAANVTTPEGSSADTTAPSVPSNLKATAASSSQVNLTWTASTDNVGVAGYDVYRNGTKVGSTTSASYSDTGLKASTSYSYTVRAKDAAGNLSALSSAASATTKKSSNGNDQ